MLALTSENYHSIEANKEYMSCSSYKDFLKCEAMAMAKINGLWVQKQTDECLVGSYIHAWNEGPEALAKFKVETPAMFSSKGPTKGELKSTFLAANGMIETLENDSFCSYMLEGEKEVIMTAYFSGTWWKIKIDTYKPDEAIIDLKTTKSIRELVWSPYYQAKVSFIEQYAYFLQMAIYGETERLSKGRDVWLPSYLVAVSKETPPDKAVIVLDNPSRMMAHLSEIDSNMPHILAVKSGGLQSRRCGQCAYCRSTNIVTDVISYRELERRED